MRCGIVVALVAGGVLSASVNNLPAAAVGAVWLVGSPVSIVVAFLIGMNVAALATPHGSAATMLAPVDRGARRRRSAIDRARPHAAAVRGRGIRGRGGEAAAGCARPGDLSEKRSA